MSKLAACPMAFVFWNHLASWLGAKCWTIVCPSLLWQSLTTTNYCHLLKQHWEQLLQLAGLKNSNQRCIGHSIMQTVSKDMPSCLHAGAWSESTKTLENMGMYCATLPTGKLLWWSLSLQSTFLHWEKNQLCLKEKLPTECQNHHKEHHGIPVQCWCYSWGNDLHAEFELQTFFWCNSYFWWCGLSAKCGWMLTSFQCSSSALLFESSLWWCGSGWEIFTPGNFKWTRHVHMGSDSAQKPGPCFFRWNHLCSHLQCCQRQSDLSHPCIPGILKENLTCVLWGRFCCSSGIEWLEFWQSLFINFWLEGVSLLELVFDESSLLGLLVYFDKVKFWCFLVTKQLCFSLKI